MQARLIGRRNGPLRPFHSLCRDLCSVFRRMFVSPCAAVPVVSSSAGQFTLYSASSFVGLLTRCTRVPLVMVKIPDACRSHNSNAPLDGHGICTALLRLKLVDQTFCIRDSLSRRRVAENLLQKRLRTTRELASTCVPPSLSTCIGILTPSDGLAFLEISRFSATSPELAGLFSETLSLPRCP